MTAVDPLTLAASALCRLLDDLPSLAGLWASFDVEEGQIVLREAMRPETKLALDQAAQQAPAKQAVSA